ncbi:MAG: hypothetical protein ACPL1D_00770 [Microgenomates group bacterium]
MNHKIISFLITFISIIILILVIYGNKNTIFKKFDPLFFEKKYFQSQWVIPQSKTPISDEDLYAYAGYKYIKGENPILINPEAPPLGKYIIGLSILLFQNYHLVAIFFALFSLFLIFIVTFQINRSYISSSLSVFITTINTIFLDQIIHSGQLEIYQLFFILLFILFFSIYLNNKKILFFIFSGLSFGAFISIKFFFYHYVLFNFWLIFFLFVFLQKKSFSLIKILKILLFLNLIALLIFIATYFRFFTSGANIRDFLGTQKWIFLFYQQSKIDHLKIIGSYLGLIFFNKWRYWSEDYPFIKYENWSIIWPSVFIFGLLSLYKLKNKSEKLQIEGYFTFNLLFSFFIIYNFFLFFTPLYPRYLLLLFFPLNIFSGLYFEKLICKK